MDELITIIVPVYNSEEYIEECIKSIIEQTYKKIEIIIIDDGSKDKTGQICDEYAKKDERIKIIHQENAGVSVARNTALENAKGKYIAFVDGDDYINKEYIETLHQTIKEKKVECVMCGFNRIYDANIEIITQKEQNLKKEEFLEQVLNVQGGAGIVWGKLWKKETIENIKFKENIKIAEDSLFVIKVAKNVNNVYVLNKALYNYRFNKNSAVRKYKKDFVEICLKSMQEAKKYIKEEYKENEKIIKKYNNYVAYHILLITVNYCFNSENKKQMQSLKKVCEIPEFKEAIKGSNYDGLSLTRKITLFTIKYKLYIITMLIGKIRQSQFKKQKRS